MREQFANTLYINRLIKKLLRARGGVETEAGTGGRPLRLKRILHLPDKKSAEQQCQRGRGGYLT
jgi:hypothetical protein